MRAAVPVGSAVAAGQRLGEAVAAGAGPVTGHLRCPAGSTCVHWGVLDGREAYLDPWALLQRWVVRLVPYA